ncbi:unnamed protein product [Oncorhynchus mykiss]|uniref:Thioredoxin domain-containing protein n=1 Tax=Oncorhynchus mykiss TaxID=8022 RepID=A0A060XEX1_ONCMY|nr:unnamed protein product [Oncorhynchus mykiss]
MIIDAPQDHPNLVQVYNFIPDVLTQLSGLGHCGEVGVCLIKYVDRRLLYSWKDPNNEFKKTLKLSGVPTLIRYGTKLVEEECFKADLVRMMFTED